MAEQHQLDLRALVFDVFGTVVDWRSSIIAEGLELGRRTGIESGWGPSTSVAMPSEYSANLRNAASMRS